MKREVGERGSRARRGAAALAAVATILLALPWLALSGCAVRVPRSLTVSIPAPAGKLEGALYLPDGRGPHPGVVIVGGAYHDSRLDYVSDARFLASHGIAVLTYDKRGTGGSDGRLAEASFDHLAFDAAAAARYLRARAEVDSTRVGLWGVGEGGWVAPLAAVYDSVATFLVLVSAPVVSPLDQLSYQRTEELAARGMKRTDAEAQTRLRRRIWEFWMAPPGSGTTSSDSLRRAFEAATKRPWFAAAVESRDLPETLIPDEGMGAVNHPARAWLAKDMPAFWSLRHDPIGILERVRVPILAIYGDQDRDVPVVESVVNFQAALGRAYNRRGIIRPFRGADHALNVRSGPGLLAKVEPAPGYRDTVVAWLGRVAGAGAARAVTAPDSRASSPR
ncbi:MAG TPA: alpha/beta hydrolase [Candidatus Eisenbacteria bacterium]|nr:alpha/beta hydrolase [Candidatus Eisenbacteria bacterium]